MADLENHIAQMKKRRFALLAEIDALSEGDRKTALQMRLGEIEESLQTITSSRPLTAGRPETYFVSDKKKLRR